MQPHPDPQQLCFFLGGRDLEMQTIAELLRDHVAADRVVDFGLSWGAKASDYAEPIAQASRRGLVPVLVELAPDIPLPGNAVIVDHHDTRAGRAQPTSLEQVFALLNLGPQHWTRRHELVAANDRGYLAELRERGATVEEMRAIRAADRAAQGITARQETEAERAVGRARPACGGLLTVVELPHSQTAAAADRMEPLLGGPGYQNLLIGHPEGTAFYGAGAWIERLREHFPASWFGGALPERGYWGSRRSPAEVLGFLGSAFPGAGGAG